MTAATTYRGQNKYTTTVLLGDRVKKKIQPTTAKKNGLSEVQMKRLDGAKSAGTAGATSLRGMSREDKEAFFMSFFTAGK